MTKLTKILSIILFSFLLSGCWDANENERMFYIHGIGVDYKDGEYEVYVQIISFSNVAKTEQVNQDVIQSEVTSAKGKTFTEALFELYHGIDEKLYWGHLTVLIISDEVMKEGRINTVINTLTRYSEVRYHVWVYTTDEPLEEFLLALPLLKRSITLTKLADPINSFEQESYLEPVNIRKLVKRLNEPSFTVTVPYVQMKTDWQNQKGTDASVEIDGVGIISPKESKGFIKGDKAKGLQWMSDKTKRGQITEETEEGKKEYTTIVIETIKNKVIPVVNGTDVKFEITIHTDVSLNSFTETVSKKIIHEKVEKAIKNDIETTFNEGIEKGADIYRLGEVLYRDNVKVWKKIQKEGQIKLTKDSIKIKVYVDKISSGRKNFEKTINQTN